VRAPRARLLVALASLLASDSAAAEPCPPVRELVDRANRYVAALESQLAVLVGDETYRQRYYYGTSSLPRQERALRSEVAWVTTGDAMVWAFYRDVATVDGEPVGDRGARLEALFPEGATESARARAQQVLDESSRYNLGRRRTVNNPTLALTLLHPRNRERVSFKASGSGKRQDVPVCELRYEERKRPTLISNPRGDDLPARGELWIEPGSGAVVATTLELQAPGLGPAAIETTFRHEPALSCWLPADMTESYGYRNRRGGGELVEAQARYAGWRRAHVEIEVVIPRP
jgi:hypothetical protein